MMRDFPVFTTELGVASLTLSQIPYLQKAYIRIHSSLDPEEFLKECISFCIAAGAEQIFCTGHEICEKHPFHTSILVMQADTCSVGDTDAALFPVTEKTLKKWLDIYNGKIKKVPNGAWMTAQMGQTLLQSGEGYFIHRDNNLLGIGQISGDRICWVASLIPGAGADVVRALCHGIMTDSVTLEVASENIKAVSLYKNIGFVPVREISRWYRVK